MDVDNYNGSLDVLLDLAKAQKVNLEEISITKLADQFHDYISNKKDLIAFYKQARANVQDGYKYSLLDKSRIVWLSKDAYMFDATYSRYNNEYKRIFQGRGIYMYKKINNTWKMFSVSSLPIIKMKGKKPKQ